MRVDFHQKDLWESLCEKVRKDLEQDPVRQFSADQPLRVYNGIAQAVFEMAVGTAQFFSFKKSIAVVSGNTWVFEGLLPYFYKESYQVQNLKCSDYSNASQFVGALNKDTVLLLLAEDHPITGELYPFEEIEKLASDKKIFVVRVSHQAFHYKKSNLLPNSIQIQSWSPDLAIAKLGARVKTPVILANQQYWDHERISLQIKASVQKAFENHQAVVDFESQLPADFEAVLTGTQRLYDRSVVCSRAGSLPVSGEAIWKMLTSKLNNLALPPGFMADVDTPNECRWGGFSGYQSWWEPQSQALKSESMLVISSSVLGRKNFSEILASCVTEATSL